MTWVNRSSLDGRKTLLKRNRMTDNKILKCCGNCIHFERRQGNYDEGHEQGKCILKDWWVKRLIDLCVHFKPSNQ